MTIVKWSGYHKDDEINNFGGIERPALYLILWRECVHVQVQCIQQILVNIFAEPFALLLHSVLVC